MSDGETLDYLRVAVGREFGLSERSSGRLQGTTVAALMADAAKLRVELGLDEEHDDRERDDRGRFAASLGMNRIIRRASGRA